MFKDTLAHDKAIKRIIFLESLERNDRISQDDAQELALLRVADQQFEDSFQHAGWPGDGSGEDDFADFNQNEGNDW